MEPRKLTKEDLDKVRDIEGFPIGTDEDIIALSDPPYYTACPNPFIADFIKEHGTPYDEATDDYHCEPFAADVSEGKNDPIYNAHTYHTKVPYKAIMRYILHYTKPGDIVFDGFCGTGMTGVAAQMCEVDDGLFNVDVNGKRITNYGTRYAVLNDLAPIATFIAKNYTRKIDVIEFVKEANRIVELCDQECKWMWSTRHIGGNDVATVNYIAWSDVLICPNCGSDIVFGNIAATRDGKVKKIFNCPICNSELKKTDCRKKYTSKFDKDTDETYQIAELAPIIINYTWHGKRYEKIPDEYDQEIVRKIEKLNIPYWYPRDLLPFGYNTEQPIRSHGYNRVDLFYTKRILYFLAKMHDLISKSELSDSLMVWFTSHLINLSKLNRYRPSVSFPYNPLSGTLYVSSLTCESNPFTAYSSKIRKMATAFSMIRGKNSIISVGSMTSLKNIPDNVIDYIFTDPPFGGNLNYSELSFLWESWIRIKTNNKSEAIINDKQDKGLEEYKQLMTSSFCEYYRVLKPNRWITIEFHNSKNAVWSAIQEGLQKSGFIVADVRTLNKQIGTFKQVTSSSAVKQDLVISAYKPKESFKRTILEQAGKPETAWAFVQQHLANLPVVVDADNNGKIDILPERQAYLLFDRMVAYHIMQGIPVPLDATDFYKGLDERFMKRDGMYFLADQVNEYDEARIKMDVENIEMYLFVTNEKSAIAWLYQQLGNEMGQPQTYAELQPKFMQEVRAVDKYEDIPELQVLLEENFLQDSEGQWYVPDRTKEGDVAKLREKKLLKEFEGYCNSKGKLKLFRSEAIRLGFTKMWKEKNYQGIVALAKRLPEQVIQEDQNLLMYYDLSLDRV